MKLMLIGGASCKKVIQIPVKHDSSVNWKIDWLTNTSNHSFIDLMIFEAEHLLHKSNAF